MSQVLLIAHSDTDCESLAAFAQGYGKPYDLLCVCGEAPPDLGAQKRISANCKEAPPADSLCSSLLEIAKNYAVIVTNADMFGKDFMPRLSALLDRTMVGDVLSIVDSQTFIRPMYAGNILSKVSIDSQSFCVTIRSTAFSSPKRHGDSLTETISLEITGATKRISVSNSEAGRPDLTQARVVVSGGRPLKDSENFEKLIGGLADKLGGATGATRAAVDSGIAPNDTQVGQTGKIVAPELYIAAGISGSTQHIAGMKDSKVIVAINTDPDAPIFEIADFGLVQDLFIAIPELIEKL